MDVSLCVTELTILSCSVTDPFAIETTGYGFNPGSAILLTNSSNRGSVASLAATNTSLAAAAGATTALFVNLYVQERRTGEYMFDLTKTMNGCLSGLVAITAGCGTVENWGGFAIGCVAGLLYLGGSSFLIHLKLDDAVDAIPVHMFNGTSEYTCVGDRHCIVRSISLFVCE